MAKSDDKPDLAEQIVLLFLTDQRVQDLYERSVIDGRVKGLVSLELIHELEILVRTIVEEWQQ